MAAVQPSPDQMRAQVIELASRFGCVPPGVVVGSTPAWSVGAVLTYKSQADTRERPLLLTGGPLPELTVDPSRLTRLPARVRLAALAFPLAQLNLDQPRRRKKRVTQGAALSGVPVIAAAVAWSWPPWAWPAVVITLMTLAIVVHLVAIRMFVYEADRAVADVLGLDVASAFLDHLGEHPPQRGGLSGYVRVLAHFLPSPASRARRLERRTRAR